MINDPLSFEICCRILEYIGVLPYEYFGKAGLTVESNKLQEELWPVIEYDNGQKIAHPLYSAVADVSDSKFRILLLDVSIRQENHFEFYLLFKLNDLPTHCLHFRTDVKYGKITIFDEGKKVWLESSVQTQASNLIGFDTLYSLGILWNKNDNEVDDLVKKMMDLLSKEDLSSN